MTFAYTIGTSNTYRASKSHSSSISSEIYIDIKRFKDLLYINYWTEYLIEFNDSNVHCAGMYVYNRNYIAQ